MVAFSAVGEAASVTSAHYYGGLYFAGRRPMISVVIMTKDEAGNLPGCLDSVSWSDDVLVFDSFSTDATIDIARGRGTRVVQRAFTGYASQRNASLDQDFAHPWVLILDADERVPQALAQEMQRFVANAPQTAVAARMRRRDFLRSTWLKYSQLSPYFIRLVRPRACAMSERSTRCSRLTARWSS